MNETYIYECQILPIVPELLHPFTTQACESQSKRKNTTGIQGCLHTGQKENATHKQTSELTLQWIISSNKITHDFWEKGVLKAAGLNGSERLKVIEYAPSHSSSVPCFMNTACFLLIQQAEWLPLLTWWNAGCFLSSETDTSSLGQHLLCGFITPLHHETPPPPWKPQTVRAAAHDHVTWTEPTVLEGPLYSWPSYKAMDTILTPKWVLLCDALSAHDAIWA